ncbi:MAG: protein-disulfide reductase DsbD, partial [Gammaproteobacteria bacterium]
MMHRLLLALLLAIALPAVAEDRAARPLDLFGTLGEKAGGLFGERQQFLPPDEVFIPSVEAGEGRVEVHFDIRDGYYLYRDKFRFQAVGAEIAEPALPPPTEVHEDPHFGTVEIYKGQVAITLPLKRPPAGDFELKLRYQGCAEDGICYPPIDKVVPVQFSPGAPPVAGSAATASPPAAAAGVPVPEQDRISRLLAGSSLWLILLTFYGFGLLLAFTPCVFPMVPILSGIIIGQGEKVTAGRGLYLSSAYVLAMALTYAVVGVVAAFFGANLQASFQSPVVLSGFAALFVILALSMFGFFPLELPRSWQAALSRVSNRQRRGSWHGAFVMGLLSALIVGPCVAPPLAGTLLYIGATGDALLGGAALFVMGLGMGTPLLLIGASAGHWLPRAGVWMDAVKAVFGVLLLAVAIWLLERLLPPAVTLFLWAALLIVSSIYMGAFDTLEAVASGWRRLWKGLGLLLFVWGVLLVIGAASGARDPLRPLEPGLFAGAL